jgi:hypothetical protein
MILGTTEEIKEQFQKELEVAFQDDETTQIGNFQNGSN